MSNAEHLLWSKLKGKQLIEYKFRRQYSVDQYILDFYCPQANLESRWMDLPILKKIKSIRTKRDKRLLNPMASR